MFRRLLLVFVALLGLVGPAQASDAVPTDRIEQVGVQLPPVKVPDVAPKLSRAYGRPDLRIQFHVGQIVGGALLGVATLGTSLGVVGVTSGAPYAAIGGAVLLGGSGVLAAIGTGATLGAAESLVADGWSARRAPGAIALGASVLGLICVALTPVHPAFLVAGLATVPITVVSGMTQLALTQADGSRVRAGVSMIEGGAMPTLTVRF